MLSLGVPGRSLRLDLAISDIVRGEFAREHYLTRIVRGLVIPPHLGLGTGVVQSAVGITDNTKILDTSGGGGIY